MPTQSDSPQTNGNHLGSVSEGNSPDGVASPSSDIGNPSSTPLHHTSSHRLFVIILLAFGFLIAIAATALITYSLTKPKTPETITNPPLPSSQPTQAPDPTANWQTYTNSEFNFTIKYPPNWESKTYSPPDNRIPYLTNPDRNYSIQFTHFKDDPNNISEMTGKSMVVDVSSFTTTTINSTPTHINPELLGNDGKYSEYYFQIKPGEYIRALIPLTNQVDNTVWDKTTLDLAHQILSTFKFTNTTPPSTQDIFNDGNFKFIIPAGLEMTKSPDQPSVPYSQFTTSTPSSIQIDLGAELEVQCIEKEEETTITVDSQEVVKQNFVGLTANIYPNCLEDNSSFRATWYRLPGEIEGYGSFTLAIRYEVADEILAQKFISQILSTFEFTN